MNTPGYDPRAKQILGDWMVSIPSVRKHPEFVEYAYQTDNSSTDNIGSGPVDTSPQPYVEVLPGDLGYDDAVNAAAQRLDVLHTGSNPQVSLESSGITYSRYKDPGQTGDILDPAVLARIRSATPSRREPEGPASSSTLPRSPSILTG